MDRIINDLTKALETFRKNIVFEAPVWINEIRIHKEEKIDTEIAKLENRLRPKKTELTKQLRLKSAVWLKHNELRDVCMEIFDEMGIRTLKDDIGMEDFWIVRRANSKVCICEVKGKDNDLVRGDIREFVANREAAIEDDKFPSLLIANTYNKANTLQAKDQYIPSNVIESAFKNHILIVRTLDLLKILDMYQSSIVSKQEITDKIIIPTGGCVRIKYDEIKIVRK